MSDEPKLYAVLLGGKARGAHVEVHDVVFVVAPSFEAACPGLRDLWFGERRSVHVDAWVELAACDGHRITVVPREGLVRPPSPAKLFFVNVGSYPPGRFEEAHTYLFLVGQDASEVKARALRQVSREHAQRHRDNLEDVDDVLEVQVPHVALHLEPTDEPLPANPMQARYRKL